MDLRVVTLDVPPQDVITRDNVSVKVNAVVYFRVIDPNKALVNVENFMFATSQLSQTTLRSVCGQAELDELLAERDRINEKIQTILDADTDPWGIKVTKVEVKQIDLPQEMQRAIAKQAEAERERRAKVINAEGEAQAAQKLAEAAVILNREPAALTLRYLQTLREIATEKNSTTCSRCRSTCSGRFSRSPNDRVRAEPTGHPASAGENGGPGEAGGAENPGDRPRGRPARPTGALRLASASIDTAPWQQTADIIAEQLRWSIFPEQRQL